MKAWVIDYCCCGIGNGLWETLTLDIPLSQPNETMFLKIFHLLYILNQLKRWLSSANVQLMYQKYTRGIVEGKEQPTPCSPTNCMRKRLEESPLTLVSKSHLYRLLLSRLIYTVERLLMILCNSAWCYTLSNASLVPTEYGSAVLFLFVYFGDYIC